MYILFLTGGIASGKSTVRKLLQQRGFHAIDLDVISHEIVQKGSPILDALVSRFGESILSADGQLNRKALANVAFTNDKNTQVLNEIMHPGIQTRMIEKIDALKKNAPHGRVVVEIPLLDKNSLDISLADDIMAVITPMDIRQERALERGLTYEDFQRRLAQQVSDEERKQIATIIINNAGTVGQLSFALDCWLESSCKTLDV